MEKFVINGGAPLSGELTVAGNKNAALPILAACLLTEEELVLHRVPRIRDTEAQIALLERSGWMRTIGLPWRGPRSRT
jgi:UDP-N-acetylglucosamine 1-carboxyvinyltransferase